MVIAVRNKRTRRMQAELGFKADFGALTVRTSTGRIVGVTPLDKKIRQSMRNHRLINIINPKNIDRRWKYRSGSRLMRGEYEQWSTRPMCSSVNKGGEPTVDFKDPILARSSVQTGKTWLGRVDNKRRRLELHPGVDREFRAINFVIAAAQCPVRRRWKFYTDVYGKSARKGPGKGNVAQFIEPGFRLAISGEFQPVDTWLGLYKNGALGEMQNIALGIDETRN